MAKFIRKQITVEATQWFKDGDHEAVKKIETVLKKGYIIKTLQGTMQVSKGDWIVTGVAGEHYPVKPDIFDKIYEKEKGYTTYINFSDGTTGRGF